MNEPESRKKLAALMQQLSEGSINRREFLRALKMLGISVTAAEILAACNASASATVTPTVYKPGNQDPTNVAAAIEFQEKFHSSTPAVDSADAGAPAAESGSGQPPTSTPFRKVTWMCASCGNQFPSVEALSNHAVEMHGKRLPEIRRVEKPTYSVFLVGPAERFDERNTALSRAMWDKEFQAQFMQTTEKGMAAAARLTAEEQWAALEGQALAAGAIYVDDAVGTLRESYTGYNGHMKGMGGLYGWEDPVSATQYPVPDPARMSDRVKTVARFYGADLVGITKVNPLWVYSNYFEGDTGNSGPVDMPYPYAIVMAVELSWDEINRSPGYEASAATALGYSRMAELSASLAKYIRALGYPALPCGNDTAQSIPLAIDAGLGEHGRNGLLLTPQYGPRQRLCKVFTNLPLQPDQPIDFGASGYCDKCHACASSCPARAIPRGDRTTEPTSISNRPGIKRWTVNVTNCLLFWGENGVDCSNCISSCPWALRSTRDWLET